MDNDRLDRLLSTLLFLPEAITLALLPSGLLPDWMPFAVFYAALAGHGLLVLGRRPRE